MTGWHAIFQLGQFQWEYNDLTGGTLTLTIPRDITAQLPVGEQYGALKIFDANDLARTVIKNIPFFVNPQTVTNPTKE
ncbi:MAG: hypothetical protein IKD78_06270 [Bacteroidales bacterium]|nr:hypothetical protein [Bacteroidales bacterium]